MLETALSFVAEWKLKPSSHLFQDQYSIYVTMTPIKFVGCYELIHEQILYSRKELQP